MTKLSEQLIRDAEKYVSAGLTNADACRVLGISESTLYKWLQEPRRGLEVKLFDALEKARTLRKAAMLQTITKAAREGTWQAAAWYLERVYPEEYARPDRYHDQGAEEAIRAVRELTETIRSQAEKG